MKLTTQLAFLLFFFFSFASNSQAQNTLDISAAAGLSFRLSEKGTSGRVLNQGDDPALAYRFGAAYSLKVGALTYVSTGISYVSFASKRTFDPGDRVFGSQWNGNEFDPSLPSGEGPLTTKIVDRTHLLEAPIIIRRYVNENERFYFNLGIVPSFHLKYNIIGHREGEAAVKRKVTNIEFQPFQLAAMAGIGADWPLTDKLKLFTQFNGQFHLIEEVKDSGLRWWDVSGQVGVRLGI